MDGLGEIREHCRAFIDHNCIFRSPPGRFLLCSPNGEPMTWQFYMPVATYNAAFMQAVAKLFWDGGFASLYKDRPFQLCACESGGVAVALGLQAAAYASGLAINAFTLKRKAKTYGLENWIEGVCLDKVPILLIDDIIASGDTLKRAAARLGLLGCELYPKAFAIVSCKRALPLSFDDINRRIEIRVLFEPKDFCRLHQQYVLKYKKIPQFQGSLL